MKTNTKENVQYTTAIGFLISAIVMCFIAFFLNEYDINNGPLVYLSEACMFCAAVFGINLIIKNKVLEAETRLSDKIDMKMRKVDDLIQDEEQEDGL
jgi:hypothetical protein